MKVLLIAGLAESLTNFRGPLIAALIAKKAEVHLAAPELTTASETGKKLTEMGCTIHNFQLVRAGTNPLTDLSTIWSLFLLMRKIKPDVVLAYTIKPVIYGMLAARFAQVPKRFALITGLGYAFQRQQSGRLQKLVQTLYKFAIKGADKVFFQNPDDQALFLQRGLLGQVPNTVVNGSGVDLNFYTPQVLMQKETVFLMVARLLGDKGVREYAQAAMALKKINPNVTFQLAGWIDENPDSISQSELDSWIQTGAIEFLGKLSDVRQALAACSVFVLPSYREGTPRSVLEAMAIGRAVITTDAPGCRETVINELNGFLVPVQDVFAISNAMQKFIAQPTLLEKMGQASLVIVKQKYDVRKVNAFMLSEMNI